MLDVHIEKIGDLAIVECEGRVVRSEAAFQLHEAITLATRRANHRA